MGDAVKQTAPSQAVIANEAPCRGLPLNRGVEPYTVVILHNGVPAVAPSTQFRSRSANVGRRTCFIILERHEKDTRQDIEVTVDAISETLAISALGIQPLPTLASRMQRPAPFGQNGCPHRHSRQGLQTQPITRHSSHTRRNTLRVLITNAR